MNVFEFKCPVCGTPKKFTIETKEPHICINCKSDIYFSELYSFKLIKTEGDNA
jgi:uncharacterized protein (DUF983 family)